MILRLGQEDPLSEEDGYLAPYNPDVYTKKWAEAGTLGKMSYGCGINFLWHNALASPLPFVPIVRKRVDELTSQAEPGLLKYPITIRATWSTGRKLPKGDCQRLSPCEWAHAVIFKCAAAITL